MEDQFLFESRPEPAGDRVGRPLADRMRPRTLDEFVGQEELLAPGRPLREMIERGRLASLILWGPPGCGKTTLASIIAERCQARFITFSAVLGSIKEMREAMLAAQRDRERARQRVVLFIDEIHRLNKAQQDAFLPFVERGDVILIGATTENPSFEVISALLSRSKVFWLKPLGVESLVTILQRALGDVERGLGGEAIELEPAGLENLARFAAGDARAALNTLELALTCAERKPDGTLQVTAGALEEAMQRPSLLYDKAGEEHYNLISAFIKSIRQSDADAAVYWLARMIEAGEDPLFIARRLVIHASEDIGLADPLALVQAVAAMQATHFIGYPEARLSLTQATLYLALAPKSNTVLRTYSSAAEDALKGLRDPVPLHLRNAVTGLMKGLGYGEGCKYAHDYAAGDPEGKMECLPESLRGRKYYRREE
ncbi:MAG: replication-associated recombination protein A [Acidobacteria bacterium]|nr:replication-associated recombination protein A [Acidobacteriota bacterium]